MLLNGIAIFGDKFIHCKICIVCPRVDIGNYLNYILCLNMSGLLFTMKCNHHHKPDVQLNIYRTL